jgi:hypothetical protein
METPPQKSLVVFLSIAGVWGSYGIRCENVLPPILSSFLKPFPLLFSVSNLCKCRLHCFPLFMFDTRLNHAFIKLGTLSSHSVTPPTTLTKLTSACSSDSQPAPALRNAAACEGLQEQLGTIVFLYYILFFWPSGSMVTCTFLILTSIFFAHYKP